MLGRPKNVSGLQSINRTMDRQRVFLCNANLLLSQKAIRRFYYDFFFSAEPISDGNLKRIKKEMDKIIRLNLPITREEVSREDAK